MSRFQFIVEFARPYRGRLLAAMVLTVAFTASSLTPPLAMRYLIDHVVTPGRWQLLTAAVALVTFLPLWNALLALWNRVMVAILGQRFIVDLRTALYRHVLNLSMQFHGEVGAGLIMNRLMTDTGTVQNLVTGETLGILGSVVALIFSVGMVFTINWKLGLILVVIMSLYAVNYYRFAMRIRLANLEIRELMDQVTGRLQERIAGVRLVKTYNRERDETNEFLNSIDRALQYGMRSSKLSISLSANARLISGIGSTTIYCLSAYFVLQGHMTYGDLMAVDTLVWQALNPAINLTMVADRITQALVSLDRLLDLYRRVPDIVEGSDTVELEESRGELQLQGVDFYYAQDKPLFSNLSLALPTGKMTALVGHTGCGKTTVTSLLMRLWDVKAGRVTLDGHDVREISLRSLRRHMGVVPQEPVVFEGTVFDNIAYGLPEATPEQVEEAARAAQIHDFVVTLPENYQTWLGKDGAKVSVGQKQRIAIARAILRKPAVLILDEATSSLDSESEAAIQEALKTVLHGRTSVVVAHRLSTIVEADLIVAMDAGRIVEMGTHEELMQREDGYYRRLYEELKGKHEGEVAA